MGNLLFLQGNYQTANLSILSCYYSSSCCCCCWCCCCLLLAAAAAAAAVAAGCWLASLVFCFLKFLSKLCQTLESQTQHFLKGQTPVVTHCTECQNAGSLRGYKSFHLKKKTNSSHLISFAFASFASQLHSCPIQASSSRWARAPGWTERSSANTVNH